MTKEMVIRKSTNRGLIIGGIALLALALFLILSLAVPLFSATPRAQPLLLQMAAAHPDSIVSIIVQKRVQDNSVEEMVASMGGAVTKDLSIINAFAAELPGSAIPQLANANGVRWVSLDAPMVEAQCSQCVSTTNLKNAYVRSIGADKLWNAAPYLQGQGIGVAVVDSGVNPQQDLSALKNPR
jgi:hypothetical protein